MTGGLFVLEYLLNTKHAFVVAARQTDRLNAEAIKGCFHQLQHASVVCVNQVQ